MKTKILIVDDEPTIVAMLQKCFDRTGNYMTEVAYTGTQAFNKMLTFHPKIILTDIAMPDLSGDQFAHQVRAEKGFKNTLIIFMTGMISAEEVAFGNGLIGGQFYVAKPFDLKTLPQTIEEYLKENKRIELSGLKR